MKFTSAASGLFRKVAVVADKLPTPGEVLRKVAASIDAANSVDFKARRDELLALEERIARGAVNVDTQTSAPTPTTAE